MSLYQHRIVESAYVTYGSIYCQLAEKNNFTEEDAEKIHHALITLFDNDVSSVRPAGSMNVQRVYWWKHNCKFGQYAPIKVFKTLDIKSEKEYPFFDCKLFLFVFSTLHHIQQHFYDDHS